MADNTDQEILDLVATLADGLHELPSGMEYVSNTHNIVRLLEGLALLHHRIHTDCLRILSEREGKPKPQERGRLERLQDGGNGGSHESKA